MALFSGRVDIALSKMRFFLLLLCALDVVAFHAGSGAYTSSLFRPRQNIHDNSRNLQIREKHRSVLSRFRVSQNDRRHFPSSDRRALQRLTTTASSEEDSQQKVGPFRRAIQKFRDRPFTYLLIPCIAACVGWITNWMAVQMIFYPVQFRGIPLYRQDEVPLGLIGWQGIVPCKTRKMSISMVEMVTSQLLTVSEAFNRLSPRRVAQTLAPEVSKVVNEIAKDIVPHRWLSVVPGALYSGLDAGSQRAMQVMNLQFLEGLTKSMQANIDKIFSLKNFVVEQMLQDRAVLGQLFRKCGQKELDFLTNSGLWFGFLLGLIQMVVALFWENPWTLSIGGAIVGYLTNWLALKWIFEPVNPTKIGPFILQGQFLRRQKEVSAEFSKFFADKILTGERLWQSIFNDPETSPAFAVLFKKHFSEFASKISNSFKMGIDPDTISRAADRALEKLPDHVSPIYSYMDKNLGLETTLRERMEKMTSEQFERVLHPIFEEDELTLILAGAVLGFAAGLIQQGLETGQLKFPPVPKPIKSRLSKYFKTAKRIGRAAKRVGSAAKRVGGRVGRKMREKLDAERTTDYVISSQTKEFLMNLEADLDRVESAAEEVSTCCNTLVLLRDDAEKYQVNEEAKEAIRSLQVEAEVAARSLRQIASAASQMIESKTYVSGDGSNEEIENLEIEAQLAIRSVRKVAHSAATIGTFKIGTQAKDYIMNLGVESELAGALLGQIANDIERIAESKPYEFSQKAQENIQNTLEVSAKASRAASDLSRNGEKLSDAIDTAELRSQDALKALLADVERISRSVDKAAMLSAKIADTKTFKTGTRSGPALKNLEVLAALSAREAQDVVDLIDEIMQNHQLGPRLRKVLTSLQADAVAACTASNELNKNMTELASLVTTE